jgi:hypothetical protein
MGNQANALSPEGRLAVDALAVYRATILVTQDQITEPVRHRVKEKLGMGAYDFLTCPWCTSVWLAAGALLGRRFAPRLWEPLASLGAFSAVSGFMAERS